MNTQSHSTFCFCSLSILSMSEHIRGSYGSSSPELRLVLLGNIGCGKTSSADTILGQLSHMSSSATRSCQLRQGVSDGRNVSLVEAPRWYWAGGKMEDSVRKETERAMTLLAPGPHAFLLLVPVSQFTEVGCSPGVLALSSFAHVVIHLFGFESISLFSFLLPRIQQVPILALKTNFTLYFLGVHRWRVVFLQSWRKRLGRGCWITPWSC